MTPPAFAAVKEALATAAGLHGEARRAWLDGLRQREPDVHAEVVALLAHEDDETPVAAVDAAARPGLPETIGPYRVMGVLGEGGMGVVVRALQTEPLRREVAIKVLRTPIITPVAAARFRAEARALARLDHPHVAAVYDAGVDDAGRPYLAMQLVDGVPITEACRGRPLADRLAMFLDVCDAVRHAHQRGIVHRDLKPSNLLVAKREGRDWPVVIDFGIARDEEGDLTVTRAGTVLGTPAYMSPEQAGAFGGVVDTRTDVWALGVVLFEVLTGTRPRVADPADLLATLTSDAPRASVVVGPGPVSARQLRGDLDTILAAALRPEPDRRYGSVEALADDVRRHLAGRPVLARGDDLAYRVGRFVQRHRAGVAFAVALVAAAGVAVGIGVVQDVRVREQRDRAVLAEQVARQEATTAGRVEDFLVEMFAEADPENTDGETVTARDLLDRGAARIDEDLRDEPTVRAALLSTLARSYQGLGAHDRAEALATEALALRDAEVPADELAQVEILRLLATIRHDQGDYDDALVHAGRALAIGRKRGDAAIVAASANDVAVSLDALGRYTEAEPLYREALDAWRTLGGDAHPEVPWALNTLAQVHLRQGHYRDAERELVEADRLARAFGDLDTDRAAILNNLGGARLELGDLPGAEDAWREALRIYETVYGPDHAAVGRARRNLGLVRDARGAHAEGLVLLEEGVVILSAAVGEDHPLTAQSRLTLGQSRLDAGDLAEARVDLERAHAGLLAAKGAEHPDTLSAALALAELADAEGRPDVALYERVVAGRLDALGPDHPRTGAAELVLGRVLRRAGDCDRALPLLHDAHRIALAELGPAHLLTVWATGERALCGRHEGADPVAEARAALAARYGAGHRYLSDYSP